MAGEDTEKTRDLKILNHPLRTRIIQEIGKSGPLSWKDLSERMGTSTGSLYHHLDVLEGIVARDSAKRYALTKQGQEVFRYLSAGQPTFDSGRVSKLLNPRSFRSVVSGIVLPRSAIHSISSRRTRTIVATACILTASLATLAYSNVQALMLSVAPSPGVLQSIATSGASAGVLAVIVYGWSKAAMREADMGILSVTIASSFLPIAAFSLLLKGLSYSGATVPGGAGGTTLLLAGFQGWSVGILGAGISASLGLRIEKALLGSLGILYTSTILMLTTGVKLV